MKKRNALLSIAFAAVLSAGVGVATINAGADTAEKAIFMANGASVRYSAPSGIRFTAYVNDDYFTAGALNEGVTVGMKISVDGVEKDFSTATATEWKWATSDVDGYYKYHVVIGGADGAAFPADEYGTALTATAYVTASGTTETSEETVTRSIAQVANAALAENEILKAISSENVLSTDKVTVLDGYTVATTALENVDESTITKNGDSFVWGAVDGALGYFVSFNGEVQQVIGENTVLVTTFGEVEKVEGDIFVIAYGDGETATYSEAVKGTIAETAVSPVLIDFNDASHVNNIGYIQGGKWNQWKAAPTYNESEGTVSFAVLKDYFGTDGDWNVLSPFTVTLPKALEISDTFAGIKVRLYVDWVSPVSKVAQSATFAMLDVSKKSTWRTDAPSNPSITLAADTGATGAQGWMVLSVSNAQLEALGYKTGDTVLTFGIWVADRATAATMGSSGLKIDYIEYITRDNEILNFNSEADAAKLVAGNPESGDSRIKSNFRYNETAMFDATKGDGGAVYAHALQSNGFSGINVFFVTVKLDKAIDVSSKAGIEVKFQVSWISAHTVGTDSVYFSLMPTINADGTTPGAYMNAPTEESSVCKSFLLGDDFATLKLSAEDLTAMGYEGKTQLTFAVFAPKAATLYGQSAEIWFDDIRYYEANS